MAAAKPVAAGAVLFLLAACGTAVPTEAASSSVRPLTGAELLLSEPEAVDVLDSFITGDSKAMVSASPTGLAEHEVDPSLTISLGSLRRSAALGSDQAGFGHQDPVIALPTADAPCLITATTLVGAGSDLVTAVLALVPADGRWKAGYSVVVPSSSGPGVQPVGPATELPLDQEQSDRIAQEIFARSIGDRPPTDTLVATSDLVDSSLSKGVTLYADDLATRGVTLNRTLERWSWLDCGAPVRDGTLTFLELYPRDTLTAAPGGQAELGLDSIDAQTVGLQAPLTGPAISVDRVQLYLVLVPNDTSSPVSVLGIADSAVGAGVSDPSPS